MLELLTLDREDRSASFTESFQHDMDIFIGHYLDLYKTLTIQIAVQASLTGTLWQQDKRKI